MEVGSVGEIIRSLPWGLIGWYDFNRKEKILYIGKKEDPLAGFFHVRGYDVECKEIDSINKVTGEAEKAGYGYIVCVACLEQAYDPAECLEAMRIMLKQEGSLLLGMNNRFGLRYFCGDTDTYTGQEFDGIEGYLQRHSGRCYSRDEIKKMLDETGFESSKFYSVFPGLEDATLLLAPDYVPNEDLSCRVFPTYNSPGSIYIKEESLYPALVRNGLLHGMANAFFIECPLGNEPSDVLQVTSSLQRGRENGTYTIIRAGTVEKKAAWPEGIAKFKCMKRHDKDLMDKGIRVVKSEIREGSCVMPFIKAPTVQTYLKELLHEDRDRFLEEMDRFRDAVLRSSETVMLEDGTQVFNNGYFDLVPLNCFIVDKEYLFFDQEFCIKELPVKVMAWRQVASFYFGDPEAEKRLPMEELLLRYELKEELSRWQAIEWEYLDKVLNNKELRAYYDSRRASEGRIRKRREAINGSREKKLYHIGYCAGAFDMFHIGHLNLLRRAKERCDYLIVGVMSDERMYDLKKKYPVIPCNERMQVVAGCRYVDQVEELPADRAGIMDAYNMFHFDCMFSGDDHANDAGWLAERGRLREHGSDIVFVSYTKETSSSAIREKMKKDADQVNPDDSRLLTDKNHRWIYTYDYAPDSVWEEWRSETGAPAWIEDETDAVAERVLANAAAEPGTDPDMDSYRGASDGDGSGLSCYILLADSHFAYNGTWDDTVASMRALCERIRIKGIIHLGDLTDGLLPLYKTKQIEDKVMSDMKSLGIPVHVVPGNHDYNYFRGNPEVKYPEPSRYYVDDRSQKLRMCFIDSFDPKAGSRYGFTEDCIAWLGETLSEMSEGYKAIIFSHLTPLVRLQAWTDDIRNRSKLIEVLDKHADKIMAFINGHNHCDHLFNDLKNGQFPIISINCAKCEYFLEHKPKDAVVPFRRLGDRTQESFDIMQVDTVKNEIYFTRFGAGRDRVVRNHKAEWM